MRLPVLSDASLLVKWAAQVVQQYEKDYFGLRGAPGTVTLAISSASTTLSNAKIRATSVILFTPTTEDARTSGAPSVTAKSQGQATLTHANAGTTRTYDYLVTGT